MSWYPDWLVAEVEEVASFVYIDARATKEWNEHKRDGELRLLTGWCWTSRKNSSVYRQGFKTRTVAQRDAYYALISETAAPAVSRRFRVVRSAA